MNLVLPIIERRRRQKSGVGRLISAPRLLISVLSTAGVALKLRIVPKNPSANDERFESVKNFPFMLSLDDLGTKGVSREPALSGVEVPKHGKGFFRASKKGY